MLQTVRAYLALVEFDLCFGHRFSLMHDDMRRRRTNGTRSSIPVAGVCASVDIACSWYWREVLCLQRSAVTVWLLRQHGIDAELLIGIQQYPFEAHAWVEVDGRVVNDKSHVRETYDVLDRL